MSKTVYLKLNQITEIHRKDVALKDVAEVTAKIRTFRINAAP